MPVPMTVNQVVNSLRRNILSPLGVVLVAITGLPLWASAQITESVLHSFATPPKGSIPWAPLVRDSAGNLYGTASSGGALDSGVVFKVTPSGQETVLYSFTGGADGGDPQSGLFLGSKGELYGVTTRGGTGAGVVFEVSASGT